MKKFSFAKIKAIANTAFNSCKSLPYSQSEDKKIIKAYSPHHIGRIHPKDEMFYTITHEGKPVDIDSYVGVGFSALKNIEETLESAGENFEDIRFCLDMPCGYGRVLRVLQTKIKPEKITACDLNEEAVAFCNSEFGVEPLISNVDFRKINFNKKYDLIWVGSLATHIDSTSFSILMEVLFDILEIGGILIFTTCGEYSIEVIDNYGVKYPVKEKLRKILKKDGYFFAPYENSTNFGIGIFSTDYILSEINQLFDGKLKLLRYKYKGWDNHQDVYSYQRISE